jgi:hypothetical protein
MNAVELSRKAGKLNGFLNRDAMDRLIEALENAKDYDAMPEPYKTWITDHSAVKEKDLSYAAKMQRKQERN